MNRRKMPEIEKVEKMERERRGGVQSGSRRPAARRTAEAHHSANYDQAFPRRHGSAGDGESLFSHNPDGGDRGRRHADELRVRTRRQTLASTQAGARRH